MTTDHLSPSVEAPLPISDVWEIWVSETTFKRYQDIVEEKIFGALLERKKPRDFYDLYIMMRKGMLSAEQKKKLGPIKDSIMSAAKQINFKSELGTFLPIDQQGIIRDFPATLLREMNSQLSGV